MIASLDELTPAARTVADAFLAGAAEAVEPRLRSAVREDLTAHLCEHLWADSTEADVKQVIEELGVVGGDGADAGRRFAEQFASGFRLRGMGERLTGSLWNPADERLFLPRALGWGWDLNLGAVAVRLGLIEPDAEAVPFTSTPDPAFRAAALVPAALAGATVLHYLVRGRRLPAVLPSHWDGAGRPDRWVPKGRAAALDLTVTGLAAVAAAWAARSSRPAPERAGLLAGTTMAGTIAATVTVLRSDSRRIGALAGPALVGSALAAVGGVLLGLARAGRRAELEADLRRNDG